MKKIFSVVLIMIFTFTLILSDISAQESSNVIIKETNQEILDGGVTYEYNLASTSYLNSSSYTDRNVYSLTVSGDNEEVKVATWSYTNKHNTSLVTLDTIAKDYETNHPGWIVVGGINAEGYWNIGGKVEISNAFNQDGDMIKKDVSTESFKELIGFKSDRTHVIDRCPEMTEYLNLTTYDENKEKTHTYDVKYLNTLPEEKEIAILTNDFSGTVNVTDYIVLSGKYDLYRSGTQNASLNNTQPGIFVKGKITERVNLDSINKVTLGFYIVTKNEAVAQELLDSSSMKCQFDFVGDFSDVDCSTGYMYKLIENGKTKLPTDKEDLSDDYKSGLTPTDETFSYNCAYYTTTGKERSAIGFKADGSIVLLTSNTKTGGPTQYELAEILQTKECINAYQFDGGGSVTFVKRTINGEFEILNECGDGHPRSISTGIFFVTRDAGLKPISSTRDSITVSQNELTKQQGITNIITYVDEIPYKMDSEQLVIDNLSENTNHLIYFTYDIPSHINGELITTRTRVYEYSTKKYFIPSSGVDVQSISKNKIEFMRYPESGNYTISNINIHIGDLVYQMGSNLTFTCDNLIDDTEYEIYYTYDVLDKDTNKTYQGISEITKYRTLAFELPTIVKLEVIEKTENYVKLAYEYTDPDDKVENAYITYENKQLTLTRKKGTVKIENLDLTLNEYQFNLYLQYYGTESSSLLDEIASDDVIVSKIEITDPIPTPSPTPDPEPTPEPTPEPIKKKGCKKSSAEMMITTISMLSLLVLMIKKENK